MKKIGFQGEKGAYSELAAFNCFGPGIATVPFREFAGVFHAVMTRKVDVGIIPIENSLAGSIHQNYDLMLEHEVKIIGEFKQRVNHHLLAPHGVKLGQIRRVYSHPQALAQCQNFFRTHKNIEPVSYFDTAGSARHIATLGDPAAAAIASIQAAKEYNLKAIQSSIEDSEENSTRFLLLVRQNSRLKPPHAGEKGLIKTSIVFALRDIPGALFKGLSVFALRDIDLVKIESRPYPGSPWRYLFYLDFLGDSRDDVSVKAINNLREITVFLKVLGSYAAVKK
jgi:prephenate dehydratase